MKKVFPLTLIFAIGLFFNCSAQLNMSLVGQLPYTQQLNDIWGYQAPDGTEYALVGTVTGFSIVSLADTSNPTEVAFIPGTQTTWRDIKTWEETAYVVCDNCPDGMLVVDLADLPNSAPHYFVTDIPNVGVLGPAHNIYMDEFGYAYLSGSNLNNGGMIFFDCFTTPGTPIWAGTGSGIYSHDVYVRDNKMYSSEINDGQFSIYDVTDKNNVVSLGSQNTPFNFTHNGWLSDDGNTLYTTDEQANAPVASYDVSDPNDIIELDQFRPFETVGDGVIPHNVHVWDDFLIISYYTDGCILVDAAYPDNLIEVGNFDSFIPASTGFAGAWGAYPYSPTGLVFLSDMGNGLYILEPNYVRACYLEGDVTDQSTGSGIANAQLTLETTNVVDNADAFGDFKTGYAVSGTYDVTVTSPGYETGTAQITLVNGEVTTLNIELIPLIPFVANGTITDAISGAVIPKAQVRFFNDVYDYTVVSDDNGDFEIPNFYEGTYDAYAGAWGYTTHFVTTSLDINSTTTSISIEPGYEDNFVLNLGWSVSGPATTGQWERGEPIGVFVDQQGFAFWLTPPEDVMEDLGNSCFVTGNGPDIFEDAVNGGMATLTSPTIDMTDWSTPIVSMYHWFFNVNVANQFPVDGNDALYFKVSNGNQSVSMGSFNPEELYLPEWTEISFNVADFIALTDSMTFSMEISNFGGNEITDVAIDYFRAYDAGPNSTKNQIAEGIKMNIFPNPSTDFFVANYDITTQNDAYLIITNLLGQEISKISLDNNIGQLNIGANLGTGIYFVQIENDGLRTVATKIVKQ